MRTFARMFVVGILCCVRIRKSHISEKSILQRNHCIMGKILLDLNTGHMGVRRKKCKGGQKHFRDGHLSESYSQVSVSDRVTH